MIRLAQACAIQDEKLAAIGQLASGVAHQINNPLTGIIGFTEILLQNDSLSSDQKNDLREILEQGRRCRDVVRLLLQFAGSQRIQNKMFHLKDALTPILELIHEDFLSANISIDVRIPENTPSIYGDRTRMEQVFLSLITNARQAMEGLKKAVLTISASISDKKIVIDFQDAGPGIPAAHINRVFDPFFTTRPIGQGMGLGLSVAYAVVRQHNGTITCRSRKRSGALFTIKLPLHSGGHHA